MCCQQLREKLGGGATCYSRKTSVKEKGKSCRIDALPEGICTIHIDHPAFPIPKEYLKCDFCFVRCEGSTFHFVELKGQDIKRAFLQIEQTVDWFSQFIAFPSKEHVYGYIICSRVTKASPQLQVLKDQFRKKTGKRLIIQSRHFTISYT